MMPCEVRWCNRMSLQLGVELDYIKQASETKTTLPGRWKWTCANLSRATWANTMLNSLRADISAEGLFTCVSAPVFDSRNQCNVGLIGTKCESESFLFGCIKFYHCKKPHERTELCPLVFQQFQVHHQRGAETYARVSQNRQKQVTFTFLLSIANMHLLALYLIFLFKIYLSLNLHKIQLRKFNKIKGLIKLIKLLYWKTKS